MASSNFSLRAVQLAGTSDPNGTFNGLSVFRDKIVQDTAKLQEDSSAVRTELKCTVVVLVLFALMAAGGSAALIYLSNGPYNNLSYFVSGLVLGTATLALLVGIAIAAARSSSKQKALKNDFENGEAQLHPLKTVLSKMTEPGTTDQEIKGVMGALDVPTRGKFITETYKEFFCPGPSNPVITDERKKVLNAFTTFEDTLISEIDSNNFLFAWNLLKHIDHNQLTDSILVALFRKIDLPKDQDDAHLLISFPEALKTANDRSINFAVLNYADPIRDPALMAEIMMEPASESEAKSIMRHEAAMNTKMATQGGDIFAERVLANAPADQNPALLDALFAKVGDPCRVSDAESLARHPLALLRMMNLKNVLAIAKYPQVIAGLAIKNPLIFTPKVLAKIYPKMTKPEKTAYLNFMADASNNPNNSAQQQQVIFAAVQLLLSQLITEIVAGKNRTQNADERKQLLAAMTKWPKQAATSFFEAGFTVELSLNKELRLLNSLYAKMISTQIEVFKEAAVQILSSRKNAAAIYPKLITAAYVDKKLREPLYEIMVKTPVHMAEAMNMMTKEELGDPIIEQMSASDREIYRLNLMRTYKRGDLDARLTDELLKILKDPRQFSTSYSLAYFQQFPNEFKSLVLKNEHLGDQSARGRLALTLLEQMEEKADAVIQVMDNLEMGYPYYNYLTNMLVNEAQGTRPNTSRARLMARFALAKDEDTDIMTATRDKIVISTSFFGPNEWELLKYDAKQWKNFDEAVATQSGIVYKKS